MKKQHIVYCIAAVHHVLRDHHRWEWPVDLPTIHDSDDSPAVAILPRSVKIKIKIKKTQLHTWTPERLSNHSLGNKNCRSPRISSHSTSTTTWHVGTPLSISIFTILIPVCTYNQGVITQNKIVNFFKTKKNTKKNISPHFFLPTTP